jgi:hypothetical protein
MKTGLFYNENFKDKNQFLDSEMPNHSIYEVNN